jgi:hypothetical protein
MSYELNPFSKSVDSAFPDPNAAGYQPALRFFIRVHRRLPFIIG